MAINCIECGLPVHENAVKCPHCGRRSGAAPTKPTRAEAAAIAQVEGVRFYNAMEAAAKPTSRRTNSENAAAAFQFVSSVVTVATTPDLDRPLPPEEDAPRAVVSRQRAETEPAVPRAVARDRPSAPAIPPPRAAAPPPPVRPVPAPPPPPPVTPVASKAPDPAPPPGDQPRFLK